MRELTQEIKEKIKEGVILELHPSLIDNQILVDNICKQREDLYIDEKMEVSLNG